MKRIAFHVLVAVVTSVAGCATGCATARVDDGIVFRVIDAASGAPLHGVDADREGLPSRGSGGRIEISVLGRTGRDGTLPVGGMRRDQTSLYGFHADGYQRASVAVGPRWDSALIVSPVTAARLQTGRRVPIGAEIVVPLHPQGGTQPGGR